LNNPFVPPIQQLFKLYAVNSVWSERLFNLFSLRVKLALDLINYRFALRLVEVSWTILSQGFIYGPTILKVKYPRSTITMVKGNTVDNFFISFPEKNNNK